MQNSYGQYGWKEFHRNRKDILSEYDKILEQTENRPLQVAHGVGVEAYIRKWLSEFLPKKFGVTSGYIIPDLYDSSDKLYHYDIIIYDQLSSPILWTEGNQDDSEQGKYRAIPAKHVVAIYEVKSRFTKENVKEAIDKLNQTKVFTNQLHPNFSCGIFFIELKESDVNKDSIIKELINAKNVFKFSGGIVLRYEGDNSCTGKLNLFERDLEKEINNERLIPLAKPMDDLNIYFTEEGNLTTNEQGAGVKIVQTNENIYSVSISYNTFFDEGSSSAHLSWSRGNFSNFCIELLSTLEGLSYDDKDRPSFGQIFDIIKVNRAPLQNINIEDGKPFLQIKLVDKKEGENNFKLSKEDGSNIINFRIQIENLGEYDVLISSDSFKNTFKIPKKMTAIKTESYRLKLKKDNDDVFKLLKKKKFHIPFRLVYYEENIKKEFVAIEKNIVFKNDNLELT